MAACKTFEQPDINKSQSIIDYSDPLIKLNEALISNWIKTKPLKPAWSIRIRLEALNILLEMQAKKSLRDIIVKFTYSPKVISEKTSILGFDIENFVDIDTGNIDIDIKQLALGGNGDTIELRISAAGRGTISLSAKYYGIPAGASPDVEATADEIIRFRVTQAGDTDIVLVPVPAKIKLKIKFYVDFLAWKIPWSENIELEAAEIIKPLKLPLSGLDKITLPVPAKPGSKSSGGTESKIRISNFMVNIKDGYMEISSGMAME